MKHEIKLKVNRYPAGFHISLRVHNLRDAWDMTRNERISIAERCLRFVTGNQKARLGKQSHLKAVPDSAGQDYGEAD